MIHRHRLERRAAGVRSHGMVRIAAPVVALGALLVATLAPAVSAVAPAHATIHPSSAHARVARDPAKPRATPRGRIAPADEYFGRLQMSVLGVRSKVKDLGLLADAQPDKRGAVLNNAVWVEDAMRDWARKYPFDRWLPRYAWALEAMYERIPGAEAHKRAIKQLGYITAYFPQTIYGKIGRAKLAAGVPTPEPDASDLPQTDLQRLALIDGKVLPTIPPAPEPSPSVAPATDASGAPLPVGTAAPASSGSF